MIFCDQIAVENRIVHLPNVVCPVALRAVDIRAGQAALQDIRVKQFRRILLFLVIPAEFREAEREQMNFDESACKECR